MERPIQDRLYTVGRAVKIPYFLRCYVTEHYLESKYPKYLTASTAHLTLPFHQCYNHPTLYF